MSQSPAQDARFAARGSFSSAESPDTPRCACGCGEALRGARPNQRFVDLRHKRRWERRARKPPAPPGMGRKRAMRAEIGAARLRKLWRVAGRLGVKDWREALDTIVEEALR